MKNFGARDLRPHVDACRRSQADVEGKLDREYPDAADVNRIYALSYSACVACRLDPTDWMPSSQLPKDFQYAVEIRNAALLGFGWSTLPLHESQSFRWER